MQEFFQSEQYKHFWLFLVKSGFTVGLLSVTCSVLPALLTFSFGGDKTMLIAVFIFGFGYGLIAALLEFSLRSSY